MNAREILKSTPFFGEALDDAEIAILAGDARQVGFAPGATLVREDDEGRSMFVILSGDVTVTVADEEEAVAELSAGAVIGEMSLLTGAPRNATVTAKSAVDTLEIDKAALANVLWMSPTLVDRFVAMLFRRQKELDRLSGGAAWGMVRPGKAELAAMIRDYFQTTNAG